MRVRRGEVIILLTSFSVLAVDSSSSFELECDDDDRREMHFVFLTTSSKKKLLLLDDPVASVLLLHDDDGSDRNVLVLVLFISKFVIGYQASSNNRMFPRSIVSISFNFLKNLIIFYTQKCTEAV